MPLFPIWASASSMHLRIWDPCLSTLSDLPTALCYIHLGVALSAHVGETVNFKQNLALYCHVLYVIIIFYQ